MLLSNFCRMDFANSPPAQLSIMIVETVLEGDSWWSHGFGRCVELIGEPGLSSWYVDEYTRALPFLNPHLPLPQK